MVGRLEFSLEKRPELSRGLAEDAGSPNDAGFRIIVMGDFSGRPLEAEDQYHLEAPHKIDIDNFDTVLARLTTGMRLSLPEPADGVFEVSMRSMEDFEPDALFLHHPLFARLRGLRSRLADPATFEAAAAEMQLGGLPLAALPSAEDDQTTLSRLLGTATGGLPPNVGQTATGLPSSLDRLLRSILAPHIRPATAHLQQPLLDAVDKSVGDVMRQLLRHPTWRNVEASWRCVDNFLRTVDAQSVTLEVLDVHAAQLARAFDSAKGEFMSAELVRSLGPLSQGKGISGRPAVVVGLYEFGSGHDDLALLSALAAGCREHGAVLLASAAPGLVLPHLTAQLQRLSGLSSPEPASAWQGLRDAEIARHVALVYPRVLGRLPYGPNDQPVTSFAFDELGDGPAHDRLSWRSAALDAAALLARAFDDEGGQFAPEARRSLGEYPAFVDRSQSEPKLQACAETFLSERELAVIADLGLIALISDARLPRVRLGHWRSIASDGSPLQGCWCT